MGSYLPSSFCLLLLGRPFPDYSKYLLWIKRKDLEMSYVLTKFTMVMPPCAAGALPCLIWICCGALVSIQAVNLHFVCVRLFQYSSLQQNYKRQMFCQYFKRCILKQHVLDISLALPLQIYSPLYYLYGMSLRPQKSPFILQPSHVQCGFPAGTIYYS